MLSEEIVVICCELLIDGCVNMRYTSIIPCFTFLCKFTS